MNSNRHVRAPARALIATIALLCTAAPALARQAPPLTLEEAIRLSLQRDPAAVAAEAAITTAEAGRMQARGSLLPSVSVNSVYANSSNQRFDQTTGRLVSESYTAQLSGSYELFGGGRRIAELRLAGADVIAAEATYRAQSFATILQTTRSFYEAAAAVEVLGAAEQRLARARQQEEFARARLEVGTVTMSDALRAELEVGNAELAAIEAAAALRAAQLELGRRVGIDGRVQPVAAALPERAPELPPIAVLLERAERAAPAVVAAEATLRSRSAARLASFSTYLPSLRLNGGYDWFSFDFPPTDRSWNVRLIASLPVFNGFQREANVQRAQAAERVAVARARDALHQARVAVEAAAQDVETSERRVTISARAVELAQEDMRVQEERYQIGAATILDLQASQIALAEAEVAYVRARQALGVAVAQLEAVLGERIGS